MGKSKRIKKNEYHFETLNQNVKTKCLPARYHTPTPPSNNICDYCNQKFKTPDDEEGIMLICGHAFHHRCFAEKNSRCNYCLEFYKKGVVSNIKSYINRLEKTDRVNNSLSEDETLNDENSNNGDDDDEYEVLEEQISVEFNNALELIKTW